MSVFVAGPFVSLEWSPDELDGASPGARLRLKILEIVQHLEHKFILGEHRGVEEITGEHIPSQASIALSELQLVNGADAIIIIPDSPGSFAELGSWAMREDLCSKALVLGNSLYENVFSYVSHGVFPMARHSNARIEWIDYEDHEIAAETISDFLSVIQDRIIARRIRSGR
ncbi:MAG: hypothetical protein M3Q19_07740 [Pseudomonadota bacterium]|nr:hypothetical protein [Pseudomonadota bacterium]